MIMSRRLWLLAACLGIAYIVLWPWHPYPLSDALKASPVLLLAVIAWRLWRAKQMTSIAAMLYGMAMVASAVGDVFLDWDRHAYLKQALLSFLVAQLCLIALLWPLQVRRRYDGWRLLLPALFALYLLWQFYPNTGAMWWPVVIYVVCLWAMAVLALMTANGWLAVGGICFLVADGLIGVNRFWLPFAYSTPIIVSVYLSAQLLLAYGFLLASQPSLRHQGHTES